MTQDLLEKLAAHRRRIRIARAAETAVRWAFYACVLACIYLAASKIAGLTAPRSAAVTVLVAVPLGMAAREWTRSFSVRDCAIYLDREMGLEERLATAVEASGAMEGAQAADAADALARAKPPRRRLPRETKFLAGSALILGALWIVPSPSRSGAASDPALEAFVKGEAEKYEILGRADADFAKAAALLRQGRAEEALALLQSIQDRLGEKMLEGGAAAGAARQLQEAAAAGAAALAAELARGGRTVHAPPPTLTARKLERQAARPQEPRLPERPAEFEEPALARSIAASLARHDWDPKYDEIVLKYFGSEP